MPTRRELKEKLATIEAQLADAEDRLPAHSVRPHQMALLLELEEERDRLRAELRS